MTTLYEQNIMHPSGFDKDYDGDENSDEANIKAFGFGGGASGNIGSSDRVKGKELQFSSQNTTFLNTSLYAFVVSTSSLFSNENRFALATGGSYPVLGCSGGIMIPSAIVKLSSALPNTMYPETRPYLDRHLPMTAEWVGENNVSSILDWIYEVTNVRLEMETFAKSLESHNDERFPSDVSPIDVPDNVKARIIERDFETANNGKTAGGSEDDEYNWYEKYQNCCLVMPMCGIKLMRMIKTKRFHLHYSHFVPSDGKSETFLGGDHNPVLAVFSLAEKFNANSAANDEKDVSRADPQAILHHKKVHYVVQCSPGIIAEYRKILRMCYRVGLGVSGDRHKAFADRYCYLNEEFEERTLTAITQSKLEDGDETMAHFAASMVYKTMNFSFASQDYKYVLNCEKEVAWSFFVGSMLGPYTASNVAWLSSSDAGKKTKLKFGMLSKSCLYNLQSTGSKWSRGVCGLTLYLMKKLQMGISPAKANMVFNTRSAACAKCRCNACALVWTNAYTDNVHLSDTVKNRTAAAQMPLSASMTVILAPEYNSGGGPLGNIRAKQKDVPVFGKGGVAKRMPVDESYTLTMAHTAISKEYKNKFSKVQGNPTKKEIVLNLAAMLDDIDKDVATEFHGFKITHCSELDARKVEMVFTDNCGGMPKGNMGMLSVVYLKSAVIMFLAKICCVTNMDMSAFVTNSGSAMAEIMKSLGKMRLGQFIESMNRTNIVVGKVCLVPTKIFDDEADTVVTFNDASGEQTVTKMEMDVYKKATTKVKCLLGMLKPCSTASGDGDGSSIAIITTSAMRDDGGGDGSGGASEKQIFAIKTGINKALMKAYKGFNFDENKLFNRFLRDRVYDRLSFCRSSDIVIETIDDFIDLYTLCRLLHHYGFEANASEYFDGVSLPKMCMVVGKGHKLLPSTCPPERSTDMSIVPAQLVTGNGPVIIAATVQPVSFTAKMIGSDSHFHAIGMVDFQPKRLFSSDGGTYMASRRLNGMYIPVSVVGKRTGMDEDGVFGIGTTGHLIVVAENLVETSTKSVSAVCGLFQSAAKQLYEGLTAFMGYDPENAGYYEPELDDVILFLNHLLSGAGDICRIHTLIEKAFMSIKDPISLSEICREAACLDRGGVIRNGIVGGDRDEGSGEEEEEDDDSVMFDDPSSYRMSLKSAQHPFSSVKNVYDKTGSRDGSDSDDNESNYNSNDSDEEKAKTHPERNKRRVNNSDDDDSSEAGPSSKKRPALSNSPSRDSNLKPVNDNELLDAPVKKKLKRATMETPVLRKNKEETDEREQSDATSISHRRRLFQTPDKLNSKNIDMDCSDHKDDDFENKFSRPDNSIVETVDDDDYDNDRPPLVIADTIQEKETETTERVEDGEDRIQSTEICKGQTREKKGVGSSKEHKKNKKHRDKGEDGDEQDVHNGKDHKKIKKRRDRGEERDQDDDERQEDREQEDFQHKKKKKRRDKDERKRKRESECDMDEWK
ncbi:hypothetical protein EGW08_020735 [Elysia chlorotica]|uniref:Uncharacterized protein n=1 Tax=Elysia chlorotica TaxID=188477 RepID=A0A3S1H3H2_ELYCH|nr:hypothetical protein EGW08_020735 [Elysia chlorotica]